MVSLRQNPAFALLGARRRLPSDCNVRVSECPENLSYCSVRVKVRQRHGESNQFRKRRLRGCGCREEAQAPALALRPHSGSISERQNTNSSWSSNVHHENSENQDRDATELPGDGDLSAVPFPRPVRDTRTLLGKRKLRPKNLCHLTGSAQKLGPSLDPPIEFHLYLTIYSNNAII